METASIRCFVAVEIPNSIQKVFEEIQNGFRSKIQKATWIKLGNFHLTLKFLGDVKSERITEIGNAIENVTKNIEPIYLEFGGIGVFPNFERPRVLWVGLNQGESQTAALGRKINDTMVKLGFQNENRFHPHLTLVRLKSHLNLTSSKDLLRKYDTLQNTSLTVDEIVLVKSDLHPSGAVYTPMRKYQLGREIVENGK